jgi:hypothetical protein
MKSSSPWLRLRRRSCRRPCESPHRPGCCTGGGWTFRPSNAKRALADVGLDGDEAALDIRDLHSLVDCIRLVRRTAMQTAVRMITAGVMLALLAGIAIKLKIFGGGP